VLPIDYGCEGTVTASNFGPPENYELFLKDMDVKKL
jgi:hypothetical protein